MMGEQRDGELFFSCSCIRISFLFFLLDFFTTSRLSFRVPVPCFSSSTPNFEFRISRQLPTVILNNPVTSEIYRNKNPRILQSSNPQMRDMVEVKISINENLRIGDCTPEKQKNVGVGPRESSNYCRRFEDLSNPCFACHAKSCVGCRTSDDSYETFKKCRTKLINCDGSASTQSSDLKNSFHPNQELVAHGEQRKNSTL